MLQYIGRRFLLMIPTLFVITILSFGIIQLPPGDYLTFYVAELAAQGEDITEARLAQLEARYGLGRPWYVQYFLWISNILTEGDFGRSFTWQKPVSELIWDRLGFTMLITSLTVIFIWIVALLIGKYAATHQYSLGDYVVTFIGFIGLAVPNFLLALVMLYYALQWFGLSPAGLFSPEYQDAPWTWGKWVDFLSHLWIPIFILGTAGTAGGIRIMRANLLDELHKPYVTTARAKGVRENVLIWRYPVRVALNPFISTIGWTLPELVSGSIIVSVVLNLPTTGPLLLQSLLQQDMFLAGSFIMLISILTVIGTLISDILLAWLDPRIRFS